MAGVKYATRTTGLAGAWFQDELSPEHVLAEGGVAVAAAFPRLGQFTVTSPAGAALGATSIPVSALAGPIPSGTTLDWTGTGELSILTANALQGATSLAVGALDAAIEAGDTALYVPPGARRYLADGTLVGRTYAERNAGAGFGPYTAGDEEVYLVLYHKFDLDVDAELTFARHGSLVSEKYLPAGIDLAAVRARYETIAGRA